jgi:hypothetical protein
MKRKLLLLLLPILGLWGAKTHAQCDCGTGADGAFHATTNVSLPGGTYNYTTFMIDAGITVTVTGNQPLIIKCTGNVLIDGILNLSGGNGTDGVTFSTNGVGGIGVAGGHNGGDGVFVGSGAPGIAGSGPGGGGFGDIWGGGAGGGYGAIGSNGVPYQSGPVALGGTMYGDIYLADYDGGSGGGGGSGGNNCGSGGGGAGGGILILRSCDTIMITGSGVISANGGHGGSDGTGNCGGGGGGAGGTIWLASPVMIQDGNLQAFGGLGGNSNLAPESVGGMGAVGRIRLDYNVLMGNMTGNESPTPGLTTTMLQNAMTEISPLCNGDANGSASALVTGGGGFYTYSWDNGPTTAANPNLGAGTYIVTITDTNGCSINDTAVLTEPPALTSTITSTNETTVSASDGTATVTASGGTAPYTYLWSPGGGTTNPLTGLDTGTYIVTITDDNGCTINDTVHVDQDPVSVKTTVTGKGITIYPNPASDQVIISSKDIINGIVSVQLIDVSGRVLATENYSNASEFKVRIDQYPTGNYMLRLNMNGDISNVPLSIRR